MKKQKIIIDTDMGNDDIMAIMLLLLSQKFEINAISLVNGVTKVERGLENLAGLLMLLNKMVPVFVNAKIKKYPYKLKFPANDIERAEKLSLLKKLKVTPQKDKTKNIDSLLDSIDSPELLTLGPLTNIAYLLKNNGELFKRKIKKITIMGGGISKGNVPPLRLTEYNFALDPKSADIVFNSGIPIIMVNIDSTSQVPVSDRFKQKIKRVNPKNPAAKVLKQIIVNNQKDFDQFYDPLAAAILIDKNLVKSSQQKSVRIISRGLQKGRSVIQKGDGNILIPLKIDSRKFYNLITKLMEVKDE